MDSQELFNIINPWDRTQTDTLMMEILKWVQRAVPIEYVYTKDQMGEWAMRNGWRQHGDEELCALLRKTQAYVVRGTPLSLAINDALAARRSLWG
jgi:hypothetical protein